jgi:hypothetical protein
MKTLCGRQIAIEEPDYRHCRPLRSCRQRSRRRRATVPRDELQPISAGDAWERGTAPHCSAPRRHRRSRSLVFDQHVGARRSGISSNDKMSRPFPCGRPPVIG